MFDLNAPIIPNESAAGIRIGQAATEITDTVSPTSVISYENGERLCFETVSIWVKNGRINQIGVGIDYRGMLNGIIGIGSTMREVQSALGKIIENDEDNLTVSGISGWCFETEEWRHGPDIKNNLDARLIEIFVFSSKSD